MPKEILTFLRWGGLSPVIQKGFKPEMPTYHAPPAKRGLYAFPEGCVERFLLSGNNRQHKDEAPRKFTHFGPLWHHLHRPETLRAAIQERGSWILSNMEDYQKALRKELHELKSKSFKRIGMNPHGGCGGPEATNKNFQVSTLQGWSLDHLEVFIEKIKPK